MVRTLMLSLVGLALAAGGPWVYNRASAYWKTPARPAASNKTAVADDIASSAMITGGMPADTVPIYDLAEILRWDITPAEVLGRWPRVSVGMSQMQLQGHRVTLVTGTSEQDLAGSLTYYFTPHQQCQRIAIYGTIGNPQRLLGLLTSRFGFARRVVNDPGLFIYEVPDDAGKPQSVLQMQSSDVLKQTEPFRRYKVSLVIERPRA